MRADEVFAAFVAAINGHDVSGLAALMARDIVFVDSLGNGVSGPQKMEAGWRGYFAMCPDYSIRVDHVVADGDVVLAIGEAGGTIDGVVLDLVVDFLTYVLVPVVAIWRSDLMPARAAFWLGLVGVLGPVSRAYRRHQQVAADGSGAQPEQKSCDGHVRPSSRSVTNLPPPPVRPARQPRCRPRCGRHLVGKPLSERETGE